MSKYETTKIKEEIEKLRDEIWGSGGHRELAERAQHELIGVTVLIRHQEEKAARLRQQAVHHGTQQSEKMQKLTNLYHAYYDAATEE